MADLKGCHTLQRWRLRQNQDGHNLTATAKTKEFYRHCCSVCQTRGFDDLTCEATGRTRENSQAEFQKQKWRIQRFERFDALMTWNGSVANTALDADVAFGGGRRQRSAEIPGRYDGDKKNDRSMPRGKCHAPVANVAQRYSAKSVVDDVCTRVANFYNFKNWTPTKNFFVFYSSSSCQCVIDLIYDKMFDD